MKRFFLAGIVALSLSGLAHADSLFQKAQATPELSEFVKAIKAAGLDKELNQLDVQFTIAAPVNSAFEKLPPGVFDKLLLPENKKLLRNILLYHMALGSYTAEILIKVKPGSTGNSIQGEILTISSLDPPKLNDVPVLKADLIADNGVIHELAAVLVPPSRKKEFEALAEGAPTTPAPTGLSDKEKSVIGVYKSTKDPTAPLIEVKAEGTQLQVSVKGLPTLGVTLTEKDQLVSMPAIPGYTVTAIREADGKVNGMMVVVPGDSGVFKRIDPSVPQSLMDIANFTVEFSTLTQLLKAAGLDKTLAGAGPFTLLAPTNAAFAKLPKATLDDLQKPQNKAKLVALLQKHVIPGKVLAADVAKLGGKSVKTLGGDVKVTVGADGKVKLGNAQVLKTDGMANNGVIHMIDTVL